MTKKIKVTIDATVNEEYYNLQISGLRQSIDSGAYSQYLLDNGKSRGIQSVHVVFEDIN
jgi:hypothetical protein